MIRFRMDSLTSCSSTGELRGDCRISTSLRLPRQFTWSCLVQPGAHQRDTRQAGLSACELPNWALEVQLAPLQDKYWTALHPPWWGPCWQNWKRQMCRRLLAGPGCMTLTNPGNPNHYIKTQCLAFPFQYRWESRPQHRYRPGLSKLDFSVFKNNRIFKKDN